MYTKFYGFSREPFHTNPDPQFLLLTETHQRTLEVMVQGVQKRKEFILILGESGSGKTTLINHLLNTLDKKVKAVGIFDPPSSFEELLEDALRQLGVPPSPQDRVSLLRQLNGYLNSLAPDETLVIIIDEAQVLNPETMDELRLISASEIPSSRKLQIIFAGQPELKAKLDSQDLADLRKKIEATSRIRPLNEEECKRYIDYRLSKAGSDINKVFTPEAISLICKHSQGNPRMINVLGNNSFLLGHSLSKKKVDSEIVTGVLEDLDLVDEEEPGGWQDGELRKYLTPSTRGKSPLFRKMGYSLLALVGVGVIILVGRIYLKSPEEQPSARFPMQPPPAGEKVFLASPEAKPDLNSKAASKPVTQLQPPATSPTEERKPAASPAAETKPAGSASRAVRISRPSPQAEIQIKKTVIVKAGNTIYAVAAQNYKVANTSIVDYILEFNSQITNPNKLLANQEIRLPEISEGSLIIRSSDGTYKVRLGTFLKREYSAFLEDQPALQGRQIEIIPRKFPSGETWYRAVAGKFSTREEGLRVIQDLKGNGLSPYFAGFKKNK